MIHQIAAPSLGSAGAFLHDTARRLSTRLADVTKLTDFLENFESTPLEEIEEVSGDHDPSSSPEA